jgi:hypothetical protein
VADDSVDGPLEHVARAMLPWSTRTGLTECGRVVTDVAAVIDNQAFMAKFRKQGKTRAAMTTCMNCWSRLEYRAGSWEKAPLEIARRDLDRYNEKERIVLELRALAALVDAHRQEYLDLVDGLGDTTNLAERRRAKGANRG